VLPVRVLVSSNANLGHFLPLVPLAQRLRERGHQVVVASEPAFAETVRSRELEHVGVGRDLTLDDIMGVLPQIYEVAPEDQNAYAVPRMFVELRAHNAADDLIRLATEWQPDVVIREPAEFASWAVAERLAIPHVTVNVGMALSWQAWDALVGPWFVDLGHRVGLDVLDASRLYRFLVVSFAPAGYQDWSHTPTAMELRPEPPASTGPLDERILNFNERPLIYATLGTEFYNPELMGSMIAAALDNDCNVVATTGPQGNPEAVDPGSPRVVVASWIAQDPVLDRTAAVMCHGGAGSTTGPLVRGVPVVVVPQGADQFHHANRVSELGAGVTLSTGDQSTSALTNALAAVLGTPTYRDAAQAIANATALLPPTDDAVDAIGRLVANP
jgi:UDP:flavonoid glycosyltransferase YjiC (YdhE family)